MGQCGIRADPHPDILERDAYAGQEDELTEEARRVWSDNYGAHRHRIGDAQRIDAGIPRPESAGKRAADTEIGWLRKRRRGVCAAVPNKSEAVIDLESDAAGHNELNTQQRAEMKFMRDKLARKKSLAFNAGSLLPSEVDEDLLDRTRKMTEHQQKLDKDRLRKETKAVDLARGADFPKSDCAGRPCMLCPTWPRLSSIWPLQSSVW
jgi:hypothetical protein